MNGWVPQHEPNATSGGQQQPSTGGILITHIMVISVGSISASWFVITMALVNLNQKFDGSTWSEEIHSVLRCEAKVKAATVAATVEQCAQSQGAELKLHYQRFGAQQLILQRQISSIMGV